MLFKKIIVSALVLCSLYGFLPQSISLAELEITQQPISAQVNYFANLYGIDSSVVSKVLDCESDYDHSAKGDGGKSKGIAQFQKPTWLWMEDQYSKEWGEDLNYLSSFDQIKLLAYEISKGNGNHWTTYRAIMNGGKYSWYSTREHRQITVYCKL